MTPERNSVEIAVQAFKDVDSFDFCTHTHSRVQGGRKGTSFPGLWIFLIWRFHFPDFLKFGGEFWIFAGDNSFSFLVTVDFF